MASRIIDQTLVALLSGGHLLLIGVPVSPRPLLGTLGIMLGMDTKRIQFTPDLMPPTSWAPRCWRKRRRPASFRFLQGPVFPSC